MSIGSTHSRSWVTDRASFGCRLGMTYPHQDGCGGVAGGMSPVPCPTPIAPFARVCASSRTSRGCYNPVKTMTLPMSSSGISISWRSLGTSNASVRRRLCISGGFSSCKRFIRCAVAPRCRCPIGGPTKSSTVRPSGPMRALETFATLQTLGPLGCWWTAKDEPAPNTRMPRRACASPWTAPRGGQPCAIGGSAVGRSPPSTVDRLLRLYVPPRRVFLIEEIRLPAQVFVVVRQEEGLPCDGLSGVPAPSSRQSRAACVWACSMARLACSKKGPAWILRDSHGGEAGVGAGGSGGSLGR